MLALALAQGDGCWRRRSSSGGTLPATNPLSYFRGQQRAAPFVSSWFIFSTFSLLTTPLLLLLLHLLLLLLLLLL